MTTTSPIPMSVQVSDSNMGVEEALSIGRGRRKLNTHALDVQAEMDAAREEFLAIDQVFVDGVRYAYRRFGMLGEIMATVPVFVFDLPEFVDLCNTACVDRTGKMFISAEFARRALHEHRNNKFSLLFVFQHELEHLRRMHLQRFPPFPAHIMMRAQDAGINISLVRAEVAIALDTAANGRSANPYDARTAQRILNDLAPTCVGMGIAMNWEDHHRFTGMSDEAIAAQMMLEYVEPPPIPNRDIDFPALMAAAAGEADAVKDMVRSGFPLPPSQPAAQFTAAELSALATELRRVGQTKANPAHVTTEQLEACLDQLFKLKMHQGLMELDLRHERGTLAQAPTGTPFSSGTSGDPYLDILKPSERIDLAIRVLTKILRPSAQNGAPERPQEGSTIKDLERALGRGKREDQPNAPKPGQQGQGEPQQGDSDPSDKDPASGKPQQGQQQGQKTPSGQQHAESGEGSDAEGDEADAAQAPNGAGGKGKGQPQAGAQPGTTSRGEQGVDMVPSPQSHSSDHHVIDPEQLAQLFKDAGVSNETLEVLGYDDLKAIQGDIISTKSNLVNAINKASEDATRLGSRYPGGHLLHAARTDLKQLSKPVISWQSSFRKFLEEAGRGIRQDDNEAWTPYFVDHRDMGLASADDIPFLGSIVPGREERPLIFNVLDLSGSVSEEMALRFLTEAVHQGRTAGRNQGMDCVNFFSDTVIRDEPLYITERNYQQIVKNGLTYSGGGGTNHQAVLEHLFDLVKPGTRGPRRPYAGRKISAITLFTDLGDAPPDPVRLLKKAQSCGMARLPPVLILAPRICMDKRYEEHVSKWATLVYIDVDKQHIINLDRIASQQAARARYWQHLDAPAVASASPAH